MCETYAPYNRHGTNILAPSLHLYGSLYMRALMCQIRACWFSVTFSGILRELTNGAAAEAVGNALTAALAESLKKLPISEWFASDWWRSPCAAHCHSTRRRQRRSSIYLFADAKGGR